MTSSLPQTHGKVCYSKSFHWLVWLLCLDSTQTKQSNAPNIMRQSPLQGKPFLTMAMGAKGTVIELGLYHQQPPNSRLHCMAYITWHTDTLSLILSSLSFAFRTGWAAMATCPLQMCGQGDFTPRRPLRELCERCSALLGLRKLELWVIWVTCSEVWDTEANFSWHHRLTLGTA